MGRAPPLGAVAGNNITAARKPAQVRSTKAVSEAERERLAARAEYSYSRFDDDRSAELRARAERRAAGRRSLGSSSRDPRAPEP